MAEENNQETKRPDNTIKSMIASLKYRFVKCEKHHTNIIPQWKGNEVVRGHKYYSDSEIENFRNVC